LNKLKETTEDLICKLSFENDGIKKIKLNCISDITTIGFSNNKKYFLIGYESGKITVFNSSNFNILHSFESTEKNNLLSISFIDTVADSNFIIVGSNNNSKFFIWKIDDSSSELIQKFSFKNSEGIKIYFKIFKGKKK
jgi:WD40 repeat protein